MKHANALVGIACLALAACILVLLNSRVPASVQLAVSSTSAIDERAALAQLQSDLKPITPHFVDASSQTEQTLTPEDHNIKNDVAELLSAQYSAAYPSLPARTPEDLLRSDLWLSAIGRRYVLITQSGAERTSDAILDSQTGEVTRIPSLDIYDLAPDRDLILYIDTQALYTYSLDQATTTLVTGSRLSGSETYHDGAEEILDHAHESHTTDRITISVFDSGSRVPNPEGGTMYAQAGQKTLAF